MVLPPSSPGPIPAVTAPDRTVDPNAPIPALEVYVEPPEVRPGDFADLVWKSAAADSVFIDQEIGAVTAEGRIKIFPEQTTTYLVVASGPGGKVEKSATITVRTADVTAETSALEGDPLERFFKTFVKPVFFDFDSAELSREAELTLEGNVRWLLEPTNQRLRFAIQGHCDARGTEEYNLALGDKRAQVVRAFLEQRGIARNRMVTVSLGEERPFAVGEDEETHALNRRAHFLLMPDTD